MEQTTMPVPVQAETMPVPAEQTTAPVPAQTQTQPVVQPIYQVIQQVPVKKSRGWLVGLIVGILIASLSIGAAAFLYFDPMDLQLLKNGDTENTGVRSAADDEEEEEEEEDEAELTEAQKTAKAYRQLLTIVGNTENTISVEAENVTSTDLQQIIDTISANHEEAKKIKGLTPAMHSAADEYFDVCYYTIKNVYDYSVLLNNMTSFEVAENIESVDEIIDSIKAVSVPAYCRTSWNRVVDIASLLQDCVDKYDLGEELGDPLRIASSDNMQQRIVAMLTKELEYMETVYARGMLGVADRGEQQEKALVNEMQKAAALTPDELMSYQFRKYIEPNTLYLDYDPIKTLYPSLYGSVDQILLINAATLCEQRRIVVEVEIPGFTQKFSQSYTITPQLTSLYIKPPVLTGSIDLNSAKDAQMIVTIKDQNGTALENQSFRVRLMSKNDFKLYDDDFGMTTSDNFLCFLTPEAKAISDLKRQAVDDLGAYTNGELEAFVGYQGASNWNEAASMTFAQTAALMAAMSDLGVRYNNGSFSASGEDYLQRVMLPADVIANRSGICIETSLTIASALQSAGMHAMLILPPGHAQVAVEIWNTGEYFLIETTNLPNSIDKMDDEDITSEGVGVSTIVYLDQDEWDYYISPGGYYDEGCYVIDCDDSTVLGLTSLTN